MTRTDYWDSLYRAGTPSKPMRACNCIGPQRGEPVCPCRMRRVKIQDGRYVEITDLGPATEPNRKERDDGIN